MTPTVAPDPLPSGPAVRPVPARGAGVDVVVDAGGDVARRALPALAVVSFVFFASSGIQLPLLSIAMANVGVSPSSIGAMWAARSLAAAVAPIGWGLVADRLGNARPLLVASLAAGGALMLWLATAPSTAVCIAIFALYGALTGPAGSMIDGMTLTALGARRAHFGRWRAVGTVGFGTSAVVVAVLLEGGWLAPRPESLFPLCAALLFLGAIVAGLAVPRLARPALQDPRLLLVAFRQPLLRGLMLLGLLLWCSHGAWAGFLSVMVERAGLLPRVVGLAVVASVVVEAAMMAWSARLIDRFGASRILVACAGLAVVRWVTSMLPLSATAFVLVHSLHGVTFGLFFIVMVTLLAERCPPELRQASQGTLSSVVFGIGGLFGGTLCGQMLQAHADPAWAWGAMAAVGVVAVVVTLVVVRRLPRTTAS